MRMADQPEEPIQNNVGRIGNLILLPTVLNSEAKARPFTEKKVLYERHRVRMIADIAKEPDWRLEQIQAREAVITSWAKERWKDI
jgi:hypothetical protein